MPKRNFELCPHLLHMCLIFLQSIRFCDCANNLFCNCIDYLFSFLYDVEFLVCNNVTYYDRKRRKLFIYQISLTNSYCSKQKLTSCVILIIPNFLARFVQKMSMSKIKLFSVTFVNFEFILNVTTLIRLHVSSKL